MTDSFERLRRYHLERSKQLHDEVRFAEALEEIERAIELCPDEPSAHWNRALTLLAMGDYARGFEELEWRWRFSVCDNPIHTALTAQFPRWQGESLADKRIAIYYEWGFGDGIMMLRYIPKLIALRTAEVALYFPSELQRLAWQFDVRIIREASLSDIRAERFDYVCPMMSLPRYLGIPGTPYLHADGVHIVHDVGNLIGIAWSGRPTHGRDAERSIPLATFLRGLKPDGCRLFSLQNQGHDEAKRAGVEAFRFRDFAEVASLIPLMDCIVTVDTAAAHLAGALGHYNVHLLLDHGHDWRWHRGNEWYPQVKRHRQARQGDWSDVFASLRTSRPKTGHRQPAQ